MYEGIAANLIIFKQGTWLFNICFPEMIKKIAWISRFFNADDKFLSSVLNL